MTDFLLKSTLTLGLLLLLYSLVLEKEKMHRFNRFFLLVALVFSMGIPFITITQYTETVEAMPETNILPLSGDITIAANESNYALLAVGIIYALVTLLFTIRLIRNLYKFRQRIRKNSKIYYQGAILILLEEKILPHTFLQYIFINKQDYDNRDIEAVLYTHELTHAREHHTFDILFIEILKTVFWFNPLLLLYKKAIQLNHEFLADDKVIQSYDDIPYYQNLLLEKAARKQNYSLASTLTFSVTKKRLLMMTKNTPVTRRLFKQTIVLPLMAILVFFICSETVASQNSLQATPQENPVTLPPTSEVYYAETIFKIKNADGTLTTKKYGALTTAEKARLPKPPPPLVKKTPTAAQLKEWQDAAKFALWIDSQNTSTATLQKYKPEDIAFYSVSPVYKNARSKKFPQPFQLQLYTHKGFEKAFSNPADHYPKVLEWTLQPETKTKKVTEKAPANTPNKAIPEALKTTVRDHASREEVYTDNTLSQKPEFPGGIAQFYTFVQQNFKTPVVDKDITGRVIITFIVEKDGSLSHTEVIRDLGYGTGEEAMRLLSISPKWIPAQANGIPVRVSYSLPIMVNIKAKT
ncbi:M56 family metallopeptidase [Flavobacterium kingsejongi]|uniref:Peptidase M56 domain-containing protein n=1 Tax=Flavobacterium kingsejongi TaxID=1678728 RepID=A0A2S1LMT1_9FLAO|nr:M56 family metallopeptidase [Flavobacterium kingsejongi]AWG25057.1 hypothetical protein FK004_07325 [Flavobacterium kingsejongi]